jgi:2-methylisocitrate lyase-like PEP mutase family enzyme
MKKATTLRHRLAQPGILVAPGVYDAFGARMVEASGFAAVYATGAGISNALLGVPDLGLVSLTEMTDTMTRICEATSLPVIADADNGYGNALNVQRAVRAYARAGVAALHIEDQVMPKRCGHFDGKAVIPAEEMMQKVRAALDARGKGGPMIIARTDALATHGFDEAVRRANLYAEAGADMLFVDALTTREQVARLPGLLNAPVLFNMVEGAKSPLFGHDELAQFGYTLVIHPSLLLRVQAKAAMDALAGLKVHRSSAPLLENALSFAERQKLVKLDDFEAIERRYTTAASD